MSEGQHSSDPDRSVLISAGGSRDLRKVRCVGTHRRLLISGMLPMSAPYVVYQNHNTIVDTMPACARLSSL